MTARAPRVTVGIPYYAMVNFSRARLVFCKITPLPGEGAVVDPDAVVRLPPECDPAKAVAGERRSA